MTTVGQTIRRLRREDGWSQDVLAWEAGGLNKTYIGAIERGKRAPTEAAMRQIATAFGVSVDTLKAGAADEIDSLRRTNEIRSEVSRIVDQLAPAQQDALLDYARALRVRQPAEKLKVALLEEADIRGEIIQALEQQGVSVIDVLLAGLANPDLVARRCAAYNLYILKDRRAVEPLIATLQHDPDGEVRVNAALALGEFGDERALPALQWAVAHDSGYTWIPLNTVKDLAEKAIREIKARRLAADTP